MEGVHIGVLSGAPHLLVLGAGRAEEVAHAISSGSLETVVEGSGALRARRLRSG
ncbi:hypothetical protein OG782_03775 [Streptomyces sp. NBC_00876]|uniref:hypothetical protein n=1 Tax=Streptomyces sp. NBC_00876 TaxID=2975853 RepID=UPI003870D251|nr:hypothetical protein OG782_03775 [Streptomyces sp. NBC_00876]